MKKGNHKSIPSRQTGRIVKNATLDTVLYILLLMLWVGGIFVGSNHLIEWTLSPLIKYCGLKESYFLALHSILSCTLAMVLIILVPKWVKILKAPTSKKRGRHPRLVIKKWLTNLADELGLKTLTTWTDIGLAPIGYFVYLGMALLLMSLFSIFPWFNTNEIQDVGINIFVSRPEMIASFFRLVVVAPIAEEIIFRGYLYGKLRERLAGETSNKISIIISILLVSLLFAILHGQWNVGVDVFALSIILCVLREITGTIHAGILLHMLKNGIAFYAIYIGGMGLFL